MDKKRVEAQTRVVWINVMGRLSCVARTRYIFAAVCLTVASCAYGFAIGRYQLFPFYVLHSLWAYASNKPKPANWSDVFRDRYERLPISADIVMLGDSHIALMDWHELLPRANIVNRGIANDTISLVVSRVAPIVRAKPKKVFIEGGINDIAAGRDVNDIANDYQALIGQLTGAGILTFVQSTLLTSNPSFNAKIRDLNDRLIRACTEPNCKYIDLNSLIAPKGILEKTVDGVHLDLAAYLIWRDIIAPEVQ